MRATGLAPPGTSGGQALQRPPRPLHGDTALGTRPQAGPASRSVPRPCTGPGFGRPREPRAGTPAVCDIYTYTRHRRSRPYGQRSRPLETETSVPARPVITASGTDRGHRASRADKPPAFGHPETPIPTEHRSDPVRRVTSGQQLPPGLGDKLTQLMQARVGRGSRSRWAQTVPGRGGRRRPRRRTRDRHAGCHAPAGGQGASARPARAPQLPRPGREATLAA